MDSEVIKKIVVKVNLLCEMGDRNFQTAEARQLGSIILRDIMRVCRRSQTFAVAIAQHMLDKGYDLSAIGSEDYAAFMAQFGNKIDRMSDSQLAVVRNISNNLFSQATKAPA